MSSKQLSLKKRQIVAYDDCGWSLYNIAKKLNCHHSSADVFLKNDKKTGNYHPKMFVTTKKRKTVYLKIQKLLELQVRVNDNITPTQR